VVVLLAFLVLAVPYFDIFGGTDHRIPIMLHGIVYDVRNRRGRRGPAPAPRCARATGREKASL
jgi:hypothetical protein